MYVSEYRIDDEAMAGQKKAHSTTHTHREIFWLKEERERPTNRYRLTSFLLNPSSPTFFFFFSFLKKKKMKSRNGRPTRIPLGKGVYCFVPCSIGVDQPASHTHNQTKNEFHTLFRLLLTLFIFF